MTTLPAVSADTPQPEPSTKLIFHKEGSTATAPSHVNERASDQGKLNNSPRNQFSKSTAPAKQNDIPILLRNDSAKPAAAVPDRDPTSAVIPVKRKSSDGEAGNEQEAKRARYVKTISIRPHQLTNICSLSYGKGINVTVYPDSKKFGVESSRGLFCVDQKLLFQHSAFLQDKLGPGDTRELEIYFTVPEHFASYLVWIHEQKIVTEQSHIKGGEPSNQQSAGVGEHDDNDETAVLVLNYSRTGSAVLRLCRLLQMNAINLRDDGFSTMVLEKLHEYTRDIPGKKHHLSLRDGRRLWSLTDQLSGKFCGLPKSTASMLRAQIPRWMAPSLNRELVERKSAMMDVLLLKALRNLLPFTKIKIHIGSNKLERTLVVSRKQVLKRSLVISERLANTGDLPLKECNKDITLDITGDIHVAGDHDPTIVEFWSRTLTAEGKELDSLLALYPSMAVDKIGACAFKTVLCKMWILAESLGDFRIQKVIITSLIKYSGGNECHQESLTWQTINLIAEKLSHESGLRRWVVDLVAAEIDVAGLRKVGSKIDPRILVDLLDKEKKHGVASQHLRPQLADLGKYWSAG